MPDEDKTTNTNQPVTEEVPTVGPTTTPAPPVPDTSGQTIDAPAPPPMQDGAFPPPPPIVEEKKPEETSAPASETKTDESSQTIPDIPPVISTSDTGGKKRVSKKMIATILGVLVLVGGIGAGVILVQNQQDIREKAAYVNGGGGGGNACTSAGGACYSSPNCRRVGKSTVNGGDGCGGSSEICCSGGRRSTPTPTRKPTPSTPKPTAKPANCEQAGGACYSAPSCLKVGKQIVNGGSGCDSVSEICCGGTTSTTTTPTTSTCSSSSKVTATNDGGGNSASTFTVTQAQVNACQNACSSAWINVYRYECNNTNVAQGCNDNGYRLKSHASAGDSFSIGNVECGSVQIDSGCFDGSRSYGSLAFASSVGSAPCSSSAAPEPGLTSSCLNIKTFDAEWNAITDLSSLVAGDVVRFTVAGSASSGIIDKAKFTINGTLGAEITEKRPGTNEFFTEYTIPEGLSSFTINAEIHHTTIGWF